MTTNRHTALKQMRLTSDARDTALQQIDMLLNDEYRSLYRLRSELEKGEGLGLNGTPSLLMNLYDSLYRYQNDPIKKLDD